VQLREGRFGPVVELLGEIVPAQSDAGHIAEIVGRQHIARVRAPHVACGEPLEADQRRTPGDSNSECQDNEQRCRTFAMQDGIERRSRQAALVNRAFGK
jgi:hypothetical protein